MSLFWSHSINLLILVKRLSRSTRNEVYTLPPLYFLFKCVKKCKMEKNLLDKFELSCFGIPSFSGVYLVGVAHLTDPKKSRIVYVGSSQNICKRLQSSDHPYKRLLGRLSDDFLVWTKTLEVEDYRALEIELIKELRPLMNKQHRSHGG